MITCSNHPEREAVATFQLLSKENQDEEPWTQYVCADCLTSWQQWAASMKVDVADNNRLGLIKKEVGE